MFQRLQRHRTPTLVLLVAGLAIAASACGGAAASSAKVATLSSGPSGSDVTATTEPANDQETALKFVACLREQGLNVPDPKFDADGNVDGGLFPEGSGIDRRADATRAALEKCRSIIGNVRFGPGGGRFDPEQMQAAFNDFTSCLRSKGLDVKDVTFRRGGQGGNGNGNGNGGGNGNANGGNGASGADGPRDGFGPPPGESGPRGGQGFDPTRRLMRQLDLDETDPAVKAAVDACEPALTASIESLRGNGDRGSSGTGASGTTGTIKFTGN